MAAAHEMRIERALDRTRTLIVKRVDRTINEELEAATRRLEQRIDRELARAEAQRRESPEADQGREQGSPGRRDADSGEAEPPGFTCRLLPEPIPVAPMPTVAAL